MTAGTLLGALGGDAGKRFECSRAGCGDEAEWAIQWRNPKIHTAERRKVWLACAAHLDTLREFLAARDFPLDVVEVGDLDE